MKRFDFILVFSVILFLLLGTMPILNAQQKIKLWGERPMNHKMKRVDLTWYPADTSKNRNISIIVCPGGSYAWLGMKHEGREIGKWLSQEGINAFVLRYRVGMNGNHYPAMIQDLQESILYIKHNAAQFGVDTARVGLIGFSAGGHLVGVAATYPEVNYLEPLGIIPDVSLRPAFIAMIYPVVSMQDSIVHKRSRFFLLKPKYSKSLRDSMSLELNVKSSMPPVFMIQCHKDPTVDYRNSFWYDKALTKAGVPHYYRLYEEKGHGFGMNPNRAKAGAEAPYWYRDFLPWMEQRLSN